MALFIGLTFPFGALLGLKFRFLILIPALGAIVLSVIARGVAHADSMPVMLITAVAAATSLQIGYLVGAIAHAALAAPLTQRRRKSPLRTETIR